MSKIVEEKPIIIAVDQGNYNVKSFGPGAKATDVIPTGVNHHGTVPAPIQAGSLQVNGLYYSITQDRLQTRRDKTEDEDYFVLTLAAVANEIRNKYPNADSYKVKVSLALGLPVEHLSLRSGGQMLREKYRTFFSNNGQPIEFIYEGIPYSVEMANVSVYAQTISAAVSDPKVWNLVMQTPRADIIDIGGGTTNTVVIINRVPQNPGITLEEKGVLELFKCAHRAVAEDTGRKIDDFMLDAIMRGKKDCSQDIRDAIERAKDDFIRRLLTELQSRGVDLYMDFLCFTGGGSVLLYDTILDYMKKNDIKNDSIMLIPDVHANAKGYYAQEMTRRKNA